MLKTHLFDLNIIGSKDEALDFIGNILGFSADFSIIGEDLNGTILLWNEGSRRLYGYEPDEVVERVASTVLNTPEDSAAGKHQEIRNTALRTGKWEGRLWQVRKSGERFPADLVITPRTNSQNEPLGFFVFAKALSVDLRIAEALAATQLQFRNLFELAPDAMVIFLSPSGKIVLVNAEGQRLFGYEHDELVGQHIDLLVPNRFARDPEIRAQYLDAPQPGALISRVQLYGRRKNGSEFPVDISLSPLQTKDGLIVTTSFRDISERKRAEERITALNRQLEERVAELAAANKELESFSYSVSHDLRSPLRHVSGFSKILLEEYGAALPEEAGKLLHRIVDGTRRMGELIDALLGLSCVGRHDLQCQVTALTNLVEEVLSDLKPETEARNIEWKIGQLPSVVCDPSLTKQVFYNLLSNALKFTRPREHGLIEVEATMQADEVVVCVRDNGVGFGMKYRDKLFGVFQRLHRQEDFEGTGIGLATVKRIVEKHGGRVWATSEVEKGASFFFSLKGVGEEAPTVNKLGEVIADGSSRHSVGRR